MIPFFLYGAPGVQRLKLVWGLGVLKGRCWGLAVQRLKLGTGGFNLVPFFLFFLLFPSSSCSLLLVPLVVLTICCFVFLFLVSWGLKSWNWGLDGLKHVSLIILFLASCSPDFLDHLVLCLLVPCVLGVTWQHMLQD